MTLSIVIICWNDLHVIKDCLDSIYNKPRQIDFEVVISDNGSVDGSIAFIREHYPRVIVVENGTNLGFARGNNAGMKIARGEYVLILNPDTIIHGSALENLVAFADRHPEAGAFGCRVLNPDGSFQDPARPVPTPFGYLVSALHMRWLARISRVFDSDLYYGWDGQSERPIGFQSGCCLMVRGDLLKRLGGFDAQFFYHFEESDLCYRVWKSGASILFCPAAEITHLGGQSVGRFPIRFALETYRSRYRFFHKHFGKRGVIQIRWISLLHLLIRYAGYTVSGLVTSSQGVQQRLEMYRILIDWNRRVDPMKFVQTGEEPEVGYLPLAQPSEIAQ